MSTRPALPALANPHIPGLLKDGSMPQVKYQLLNVQGGQEILVGRLKVDTGDGKHAFILRRFDTGAVSLTTMFRAAYPSADTELEKREVQWVKDNYDLSGTNGSSREPHLTRLAGTWVKTDDAVALGESYALGELIHNVVNAEPDLGANYRRSGKGSSNKTPTATPSRTLPTPPSPSGRASPNPPAAKRRKESSPAPATAPAPSMVLSPRRSARTKSPKPTSQPVASLSSIAKPAAKKTTRRAAAADTAAASDETAVDEDAGVGAVEDAASADLRDQDLEEQRELISNLKKAQREAGSTKVKRGREEEEKPLEFDFKEPEVGERAIATNSRISPSQRSAIWGTMAFAFGVAAVSFLPNAVSSFF